MSSHQGTNRLFLLLRFLAVLLLAMASLPATSHGNFRKQVLVLHSYSEGYKWTDDTTRGVAEALHDANVDAKIHYEYMDTKRISTPQYFQQLYEIYRIKYSTARFDAIISADSDAFNFLVQYRDKLFPGTPVVFCGVYDFAPSRLHGARLFTGINAIADFKSTIDLALKLHPKTRHILVINDTTSTGRAVHKDLLRVIPAYQNRVTFQLVEDVTLEEMLATVQKLPADSLVLYSLFFRDKKGRVFDYDESISLVAQRCPVPIYGAWDFYLGYGIVGGKLISGYFQGKTAGAMAARILQGEKVDAIPIVMNSRGRYMFDYRKLRKFDIDLSSLPQDSIIINHPANFYKMNRNVFWSGVAAIVGLLAIIGVLTLNVRARITAEKKLRLLARELERRVAERTEELEQRGRQLKQQHEKLQETYLGLELETAERVRAVEELRAKEQLLIQQSRMAAVGEMLGNIAHQWRQPLNVLGLTIQEIVLSQKFGRCSQELLQADLAKAMEIIHHMSHTIDDFRIFSTPDQEKSWFSVNEVTSRIVSLVDGNFQAQGVAIEVECIGAPSCYGYSNGYGQVLLNLLVNARDALQERGIKDARITVRSWAEGERSVLTVTDNAGGIEEAIIGKVFDAYFTTKELGKGTGIGLFMSKTIIEKGMGGQLTVQNGEHGAEFRIEV